MTRQSGLKLVNKFQKGLITEASGVNFPEDAAVDALNVVFSEKSSVQRRKGFNFETGSSWATTSSTNGVCINEYLWSGAAGLASVNFAVVQVGATIYFWKSSTASALSAGFDTHTISLDSQKITGSPSVATANCQFSAGANYLFVVHPYCNPFYVKYNPDADTFTAVRINIKIRDFAGVDDGLAVDTRPTTLSNTHNYNLKNQGWYPDTVSIGGGGAEHDPITWFRDCPPATNKYPSNSDVWWYFKNSQGYYQPPIWSKIKLYGNTQATKGHYLLDPFNQDRSQVSGISGIDVVSSGYNRPSSVSFFAGRVFFSGVQSAKYSSSIYFSRIIEGDDDIAKCYQINDPTSEDINDLLSSDGGVIKIPEASLIVKMVPVWNSLVVFATNGVWAVSGASGDSFKATSYTVKKLSAVQTSGNTAFANIEGMAIWLNQTGVYNAQPNQYGDLTVTSLTDTTIKTFINNIPAASKTYAKCSYDINTRVVQWLYRSTAETGLSDRYNYDSALNLNMTTGAFYPFKLSGLTVKGSVAIDGHGTVTTQVRSTVNSVAVTVGGLSVTTPEDTTQYFSSVVKYIYVDPTTPTKVSWLEMYDTSYADLGINSYDSYFSSAYSIDGQATTKIQANYVYIHMEDVTGSSCYVKAAFDWAESAFSNKITNNQQAYVSSGAGTKIKVKRLKIRGTGRALMLIFSSDGQHPFSIAGWSLAISGTTTP